MWPSKRGVGEGHEQVVDPRAVDVSRDEESVVIIHGDGSSIKRDVVKRAERKTVVFGVRAAGCVPHHMSGLQSEIGPSQTAGIATHSTLVL